MTLIIGNVRSSVARNVLLVCTAGLMIMSLYLIFFWVPDEQTLGLAQRIFYFHVPLGLIGLVAIVQVAIASVVYLVTKEEKWDAIAYATAEIGVIFATLILITGSIWARPIWGVWWTWDAKLTTTLLLWFIYISYLMLRAYGPKGSQGARYGSVLALIGAVDAPIIYFAAELWRTAHPNLNLGPLAESGSVDSSMGITLLVCLITFILLYVSLFLLRYDLKRMEVSIDQLYRQIAWRR